MLAEVVELHVVERSCHGCVNARHGSLTHCVVFGETVLDEKATAADCPTYEPER